MSLKLKMFPNLNNLVVESQPFGNLIDAYTREVYGHIPNPDLAYLVVLLLKQYQKEMDDKEKEETKE